MAHFAEIDGNNIVIRVIVVDNSDCLDSRGNESEAIGSEFCKRLLGGKWIQTSYNATIRKRYAGVGYRYDEVRDAFIPPQPFLSWVFDEETLDWKAPIQMPNDGNVYRWDEETLSWVMVPAP